jgi:hypothetical protein
MSEVFKGQRPNLSTSPQLRVETRRAAIAALSAHPDVFVCFRTGRLVILHSPTRYNWELVDITKPLLDDLLQQTACYGRRDEFDSWCEEAPPPWLIAYILDCKAYPNIRVIHSYGFAPLKIPIGEGKYKTFDQPGYYPELGGVLVVARPQKS